MAKILMPESDTPETLGAAVKPHYEREKTLFEAIINGANSGMKLVMGIVALLIAVLGLVALVDLFLGFAGGKINMAAGWEIDWSIKGLLGYLFFPFALVIGVPWGDAEIIAKIIGERMILTEVASYQDLAVVMGNGSLKDPRSAIIATYALCGFAHVASLAIFVGGASAIAPSRAGDLARTGFRALIAATLACLLTACVAGTFVTDQSLLLVK
jgi:CNT family concentrative nucleoside transporter